MSGRTTALVAAAVTLALVFAQDVWPAWAGFHTWQYAASLGIGMTAVAGYALGARRGGDGETGTRLVVAMIGTLVVAAAGLTSGLLGPDTDLVSRAPGTVAPLPDVRAAAFFPVADATDVANGDARIIVRRRNGTSLELGTGERRFVGATSLRPKPQTAAYVEARDLHGNHLTITQPTNPSFLSPVMLFPTSVPLAGRERPVDAFAVPPAHRQVKIFYLTPGSLPGAMHGTTAGATVLFAVDDDSGRPIPGGIGFAPSGRDIELGGLRLRATAGTYPALEISAVPVPLALWFGMALVAAGVAYAYLVRPRRTSDGRRSARPRSANEDISARQGPATR